MRKIEEREVIMLVIKKLKRDIKNLLIFPTNYTKTTLIIYRLFWGRIKST